VSSFRPLGRLSLYRPIGAVLLFPFWLGYLPPLLGPCYLRFAFRLVHWLWPQDTSHIEIPLLLPVVVSIDCSRPLPGVVSLPHLLPTYTAAYGSYRDPLTVPEYCSLQYPRRFGSAKIKHTPSSHNRPLALDCVGYRGGR
jgi:hypothetical protein